VSLWEGSPYPDDSTGANGGAPSNQYCREDSTLPRHATGLAGSAELGRGGCGHGYYP